MTNLYVIISHAIIEEAEEDTQTTEEAVEGLWLHTDRGILDTITNQSMKLLADPKADIQEDLED